MIPTGTLPEAVPVAHMGATGRRALHHTGDAISVAGD